MIGGLAGRTALVSGAGNGLGLATARRLADSGCRVVLVGRDRAKLENARNWVASGPRVETADVALPDSVSALAKTLADEEISILVNNAGVAGPVAPLWEVRPEDWDATYAANVRGIYLMCRKFLPPMIERRSGSIVNVASVSGKRPLARRTAYASSKAAVIALTETLAHEVGEHNVLVNSISPGPIQGPRMTRNFAAEADRIGITPKEAESAFVSRAALGRMVTEDEVAAAVVGVLSMTGMTGADLDLSGGMIAR